MVYCVMVYLIHKVCNAASFILNETRLVMTHAFKLLGLPVT